MTQTEQEIAKIIQGNISLGKRPYQAIGQVVGMNEEDVLGIISGLIRKGTIRKFAAIVRHQRVGYEKNALVVWAVPPSRMEETGQLLASYKEITHCYERQPAFEEKYNLFTMIHFRHEKSDELIRQMSSDSGIKDYKILTSVEEFKKSSMSYF